MLSTIDFNEEIIHQHSLYSKNYMSCIDRISHSSTGVNPACGDRIKVSLEISDELIKDINFEGACCSITKTSASIMTEQLKGLSLNEMEILFLKVREILTLENIEENNVFVALMFQLKEIALVKKQSTRCLLLPWKTMYEAINASELNFAVNKRDFSVFLE